MLPDSARSEATSGGRALAGESAAMHIRRDCAHLNYTEGCVSIVCCIELAITADELSEGKALPPGQRLCCDQLQIEQTATRVHSVRIFHTEGWYEPPKLSPPRKPFSHSGRANLHLPHVAIPPIFGIEYKIPHSGLPCRRA